MSTIKIKRITNAVGYINGNSLLGKIETLDLPDIKIKMSEHKALGMVGSFELPSGVDKLEAKIKWNSWYSDTAGFNNPFQAIQLMVRANVEDYASTGRTGETAMVITLVGTFKNIDLGKFKQHDNVEYDTALNITAIKRVTGGITDIEVDVLANIFKVNGVDILANYKINTGA